MPYDPIFARVYDILVHGREDALADEDELAFIRWAFGRARRPAREVLDAGCGRGRHLIPLAGEGYRVTGLDISADMLSVCRDRLTRSGLDCALIESDLAALEVREGYDAILCLDSALGYQLEDDRIIGALERFYRAIRPGGVLVLVWWNIFAQWEMFGQEIEHTFRGESIRVDWRETHTLDDFTAVYRGVYEGRATEGDKERPFRHEEILRAVTVGEVRQYLDQAGFVEVSAHPDFVPEPGGARHAEELVFVALRPW